MMMSTNADKAPSTLAQPLDEAEEASVKEEGEKDPLRESRPMTMDLPPSMDEDEDNFDDLLMERALRWVNGTIFLPQKILSC